MTTAQDAIARSISHNEIITIDNTDENLEALLVECDDHTETGSVHEFWGTDDDGNEWRVHARRP